MKNIIECAARGHKKAMTELYETNIKALYAFCYVLLGNKEKAGLAAVDVVNGIWNRLSNKEVTTREEFRHLLMLEASRHCRSILFPKDVKGFKKDKRNAGPLPSVTDEDYMGDVEKGLQYLQEALRGIDPYDQFVYLLVLAGGLDYSEIGKIIKQRDTIVRYHYESAVISLSHTVDKISSGTLLIAHVKSLLGQVEEIVEIPDSVKVSCLNQIKISARIQLPPKKAAIPVAGCICLVVVIMLVVLLSKGTENSVDDEDSADNLNAATTELDVTQTYYADIQIQGYGTITFELDQEAAPITTENFISLANSGFYDGLTFHRIMEGFMMQGGDPNGNGTGGAENTIVGEFSDNGYSNNLSHTRGAVSMARASNSYNSASSQFFIVHKDSTFLDGQYAVFGYVTEGMDIVDAICEAAEPIDNNGTIPTDEQPVITSVTIRAE